MSNPAVFISPDQWRVRIVLELGGGPLLEQYVRLLWDGYDPFRAAPYVQYLKTKLAAIDFLLGNLDETEHFPLTEDGTARLVNRRLILLALRQQAGADLAKTGSGQVAFGPAMGLLTTNAPVPSPTGLPDANGLQLLGDPNQAPFTVVKP